MEENWGRAELQIDELGPFDKNKAKSPLGNTKDFVKAGLNVKPVNY